MDSKLAREEARREREGLLDEAEKLDSKHRPLHNEYMMLMELDISWLKFLCKQLRNGRSLTLAIDEANSLLTEKGFSSILQVREKIGEVRPELDCLSHRVNQMEEILKDLENCPCCRGHGSHLRRWIERNESIVQSILKQKDCSTCKGTGKLSLSS